MQAVWPGDLEGKGAELGRVPPCHDAFRTLRLWIEATRYPMPLPSSANHELKAATSTSTINLRPSRAAIAATTRLATIIQVEDGNNLLMVQAGRPSATMIETWRAAQRQGPWYGDKGLFTVAKRGICR